MEPKSITSIKNSISTSRFEIRIEPGTGVVVDVISVDWPRQLTVRW